VPWACGRGHNHSLGGQESNAYDHAISGIVARWVCLPTPTIIPSSAQCTAAVHSGCAQPLRTVSAATHSAWAVLRAPHNIYWCALTDVARVAGSALCQLRYSQKCSCTMSRLRVSALPGNWFQCVKSRRRTRSYMILIHKPRQPPSKAKTVEPRVGGLSIDYGLQFGMHLSLASPPLPPPPPPVISSTCQQPARHTPWP